LTSWAGGDTNSSNCRHITQSGRKLELTIKEKTCTDISVHIYSNTDTTKGTLNCRKGKPYELE
jgi:hypothetical protein